MLTANLYTNKTIIKILGEVSDLKGLHETVRKIMLVVVDYEIGDTHVSDLLVSFLEKIELAYIRNEGLAVHWTEILMVSSLLRALAGYTVMDDQDEVNLLLLESFTADAVSLADEEAPAEIIRQIKELFNFRSIRQFIACFSCGSIHFLPKRYFYER